MSCTENRILIGALSGIVAGVLKDIPDAVLHYGLRITNITFWDYAGQIALGHHPNGFFEHGYSFLYEVIFSVLLGVVFSYITIRINVKKYLIWGGYYGAIVWFAIRAAVLAFNIKPLVDGEIVTALINSLDSIIYGVILGYVFRFLEKKSKKEEIY